MNNPLAMSDEEFLKLPISGDDAPNPLLGNQDPADPVDSQDSEDPTDPVDPVDPVEDQVEDVPPVDETDSTPPADEVGEPEPEPGAGGVAPEATGEGAEGEPAAENQEPVVPSPEELQRFYAEMTAPLKAVGKTLNITSPEELRRLAQLGANYGKAMQQLAPARKAALMLEKANLLGNEDRLATVIAASVGDKQAIQQLLAEHSIDPLDLDVTPETSYTPDAYRVSDTDLRFSTVVQEVTSLEHGAELLQEIDGTWDDESKAELYRNPAALEQLRVAKESGLLAAATAEVDRQKTLGVIPFDTPFIHAYVQVAPTVAQRLAQARQAGIAATTRPAGQPGAGQQATQRRVAAPKPEITNGDRARAAATSRPATTNTKPAFENPLAMSDEEFMKQFGQLRL